MTTKQQLKKTRQKSETTTDPEKPLAIDKSIQDSQLSQSWKKGVDLFNYIWTMSVAVRIALFLAVIILSLFFLIAITALKSIRSTTPAPVQPTTTPQISKTEGWKTYRNEEYNFEFRYPNEYKLAGTKQITEDKRSIMFRHVNFNTNQEDWGTDKYENRYIELVLIRSEDSLEEYISKELAIQEFKLGKFDYGELGSEDPAKVVDEISEEILGQNRFLSYHVVGAATGDWYYFTKNNNTIASSSYGYHNSIYDNALFNQILSTFEFIDGESNASSKQLCLDNEGVWLEQYNECESSASDKGIDKELCTENGGVFNACASNEGCRHSDSGKECLPIAVCFKLCSF